MMRWSGGCSPGHTVVKPHEAQSASDCMRHGQSLYGSAAAGAVQCRWRSLEGVVSDVVGREGGRTARYMHISNTRAAPSQAAPAYHEAGTPPKPDGYRYVTTAPNHTVVSMRQGQVGDAHVCGLRPPNGIGKRPHRYAPAILAVAG